MLQSAGSYVCDICGKDLIPGKGHHTFIASRDMRVPGIDHVLPALINDFCTKEHARAYWRNSHMYDVLFDALSVRVFDGGIFYVTGTPKEDRRKRPPDAAAAVV